YLLPWPGQAPPLLSVELCTLTWPTAAVTTADLVASALFGDGAAAVVAAGAARGASPDPRVPKVAPTRSEVYPDSTDTLGWRLDAGGFRIVLTADLADVVEA